MCGVCVWCSVCVGVVCVCVLWCSVCVGVCGVVCVLWCVCVCLCGVACVCVCVRQKLRYVSFQDENKHELYTAPRPIEQ